MEKERKMRLIQSITLRKLDKPREAYAGLAAYLLGVEEL